MGVGAAGGVAAASRGYRALTRCWMIRVFHTVRAVFRSADGSALDPDGDLSAADVLEVPLPAGRQSLCREVADSISWRRFCRIALDGSVASTTLMKLTTRCGAAAVDGLNEVLLAKAVEAKLVRTNKGRADTTVVEADVGYPTDSGLLAKAIGSMAAGGANQGRRWGEPDPSPRSAPFGGATGPRHWLQAAAARCPAA